MSKSNPLATSDKNIYGAREASGLDNPFEYHEMMTDAVTVDWDDPRLKTIHRLRLISDVGYPVWDVSYCHGQLKTGEMAVVCLPFYQLTKGRINREIIEAAKLDRVYAKGLGIFDAISTLQ